MTVIAMKMLISGCKGTYCFIILLVEFGVRQDMTLQNTYKVVNQDSM